LVPKARIASPPSSTFLFRIESIASRDKRFTCAWIGNANNKVRKATTAKIRFMPDYIQPLLLALLRTVTFTVWATPLTVTVNNVKPSETPETISLVPSTTAVATEVSSTEHL
jgi:hypothetical protein